MGGGKVTSCGEENLLRHNPDPNPDPNPKVTSCGEENLLDIADDPHFRDESVLCHEFGHTVMNIGLSDEARRHRHNE